MASALIKLGRQTGSKLRSRASAACDDATDGRHRAGSEWIFIRQFSGTRGFRPEVSRDLGGYGGKGAFQRLIHREINWNGFAIGTMTG